MIEEVEGIRGVYVEEAKLLYVNVCCSAGNKFRAAGVTFQKFII